MKRIMPFALIAFFGSVSAHAAVKQTTVCELAANPARFNGRMISFRGIMNSYPEAASFSAGGCELFVDYTTGSSPYSHVSFKLERNPDLERWFSLTTPALSAERRKPAVIATYHGLFQYNTNERYLQRHRWSSPRRFVLQSVSDVRAVTNSDLNPTGRIYLYDDFAK